MIQYIQNHDVNYKWNWRLVQNPDNIRYDFCNYESQVKLLTLPWNLNNNYNQMYPYMYI